MAVGLISQDPAPPAPSRNAVGSLPRSDGNDDGPAPAPATSARTSPRSDLRPVRIRIPAIGVTSELNVVGLTNRHTLEVPQPGPDYDQAAWFDRSPFPGERGA